MRVRLGQVATARAGDKGNTSNIAVFVRTAAHYEVVKAQLTAEQVSAVYPALFRGPVARFCVDHLMVLNFVIENGLEGGVNASLNLDAHGKSFSFLMLDIEIELDERPATIGETTGAFATTARQTAG